MKIHINLTIIIIFTTIFVYEAKAQFIEGSYSLYKIGTLANKKYIYKDIEYNCIKDTTYNIHRKEDCISLCIYGDTIYFRTYWSTDTGNVFHSSSGNYTVALIPIAQNIYEGKNEFISLLLETKKDNEIEILIQNRIIHHVRNTYSLGFISQNIYIDENQKYFFKRADVQQKNTMESPEFDLEAHVKLLGINYGAYNIKETSITFEDITSWFEKKELRKITEADLQTFHVLKSPIVGFYLTLPTSHMAFPDGFTDYAKDVERVFYQGEVIENVNSNDFIVIDPLHAKTRESVYFRNTIILNADAETFESLNGGYAKDKNHYYREGQIVKKDKNIRIARHSYQQ